MENYKYVLEYDHTAFIQSSDIDNALKYAWKVTPSKQNFMPYKVHVLNPEAQQHKHILYDKALIQQARRSGIEIKNTKALRKYESRLIKDDKEPFFRNLKTAPYVFIFTQRLETNPNAFQQHNIDYGLTYCQVSNEWPEIGRAKDIARIEIGMFCANLATYLLANGIDVSFTQCFPGELESWTEKEFNFLDQDVLLIMTAGKGKKYRRDIIPLDIDQKPSFERIVNTRI
jgi:hypothetical protein